MDKALSFANYSTHHISDFIAVDVNATYTCSMSIRSMGEEESHVYFFIDCYDKDGNSISSVQVTKPSHNKNHQI